jgi:hypothetical protein
MPPAYAERTKAIHAYDEHWGELDRLLWCLSQNCREALLNGERAPVIDKFIWVVVHHWNVRGVKGEEEATFADALVGLGWSSDQFQVPPRVADDAEEYAFHLVTTLVDRSYELGLRRREYSLASKVLHWLMPWQIPAYDSYVRKSFRIGEPEDSQRNRDTYRLITRRIFADIRDVAAEDPGWLGLVEPKTLVRGFDKYHWWRGGGSENNEKVRVPWSIVSDLGLDCRLSDATAYPDTVRCA